MVYSAILVGALAAVVVAIPQQAEHISKAQLSRFSQVFARDGTLELAGRAISQDGSCGTASGLTCGQGNCCSSLGWCGSTPLHCGTGCQSGFGNCGTAGSSTEPAPAAAPVEAAVVAAATVVNVPVTQPAPAAQAPTAATQVKADIQPQAQPQQSTTQSTGLGNNYNQYSGDGSSGAGWPSEDSWTDFETAFANNKANMKLSCDKYTPQHPDSDDEIQNIHDAILSAASSSGVDSRFILAVVMQESGGCVRAPTTNWGVRNPGLMQSFNGQGTCNDNGNVQDPCPSSEISQMINDGVLGTGPGSNSLSSALAAYPGDDASRYYKAARVYNSGSIASTGALEAGIATHCYSSDIANRLTGWSSVAGSPCTFDAHS